MTGSRLSPVDVCPGLKGRSYWRSLVLFTGVWLLTLEITAAPLASRWRWSNPAPFGGNVFDTTYGLGLTVAVTERGQIFTSEDLLFWEPRDSHTTNSLRAVTFLGERLVITGERGTVVWGDSLFDFHALSLGTSDWLEGVAASTNLLVAVGDTGAIYTSRDGVAWARQTSTITNWLTGVAWGAGTFVIVGEQGLIATSANGTNWTKRTSGTTRNLKRVAGMNNQFWAVGDAGLILSSSGGGAAWTPVVSGATNTLFDAAAAVVDQVVPGDNELRLRANNALWSNELAPAKTNAAPPWTFYNAHWDGSLFLVSGRSGMLVEGFQTNSAGPYLWVNRAASIRNWLWEVCRLPEFYVTVGHRGTVMTSVNGLDWSLELVPSAVTNTTLLGVGGTTNLLLAVGLGGKVILSPNAFTNLMFTNSSGMLITNVASTLGIFWYAVPPPTTNDLQGVAVSGSQFFITGDRGTILNSPDGTNWVRRTTPTTNFLTGITTFPGGLVAVGQNGTILLSGDGVTWTNRSSGTTNWLYRARYLGGRLIAVGQNGTLMTSLDGATWTKRTIPTTRWLNDVTLLDDTFYAVGTLGAVLASTNATNWTYLGCNTEKALYGVANYGGQLVSVGTEGVIIRSQVVPDPAEPRFLNIQRRDNQNVFLIAGKLDQRFTLDRCSPLNNWVTGYPLEFLDSSGTLLLIEPPNTNAPASEFFRATLVP